MSSGVNGIIVSNHGTSRIRFNLVVHKENIDYLTGGRQVDGAIPSLYALETIMKSPKVREAQESGKLTVLFDSGIRTGSDIIKAMALGAQGVLRE